MKKFVARQPIFDRNQDVIAYELLFRSGLEGYFHCDHGDEASSSVMVDGFLLFGLEALTGGRRAFVNFTHDLIANQYATFLPKEQAVIEILESVQPDQQVVAACEELKEKGYLLALDDFVPDDTLEPLVRLADIIKVDFIATPALARKQMAENYGARGIKMLAEKVETQQDFADALKMGYTYFQGFFFCRPEILVGSDISYEKLNYLSLLQVVDQPEPNFAEIENILKRDASLCYKLLRYFNSPIFAFATEVRSLRHGLSLLGLKEIRKWISVVALACMGEGKPEALVVSSLVRARFCEALAPVLELNDRSFDLFLLGLLSLMDAILNKPMETVLHEVSVCKEVKTALLNGTNTFRNVYELILAYEKGDWQHAMQLASELRMPEPAVADAYVEAVTWGQKILNATAAA